MLLSPELEQQRRHAGEHGFGAVDLGMAGGTECDHQVQQRPSRRPMMDDDRALIPARGAAAAAAMLVPLEDLLAEAPKVFLILALEVVTARAQT
jgi:hypothetical protein